MKQSRIKSAYYNNCLYYIATNSLWLIESCKYPNKFMTKTHVKIALLALFNSGKLSKSECLNILNKKNYKPYH